MLPTPSTSHVNYSHIYEPAEDSYLLLDTLSSTNETDFLSARFPRSSPSPLLLEIGTGSGVVLAFATANAEHIFGRPDVAALGTDVNAFACKAATKTVEQAVSDREKHVASTLLACLTADLASAVRSEAVDVLIFNPPYVPTEELPAHPEIESTNGDRISSDIEFARDSHLLSLSYAGGADGMETTIRLLARLPQILSSRGVAYLLLCAQNKPDAVMAQIHAWPGNWSAQKVGTSGKTAGWERLCVLRIWR